MILEIASSLRSSQRRQKADSHVASLLAKTDKRDCFVVLFLAKMGKERLLRRNIPRKDILNRHCESLCHLISRDEKVRLAKGRGSLSF